MVQYTTRSPKYKAHNYSWQTSGLLVEPLLASSRAFGTVAFVEWTRFSHALWRLDTFCCFLWSRPCSPPRKTLHSELASCKMSNQTGSWLAGWEEKENKKKKSHLKHREPAHSIKYLQLAVFTWPLLSDPVLLHHPISFKLVVHLTLKKFKSCPPTSDVRVRK